MIAEIPIKGVIAVIALMYLVETTKFVWHQNFGSNNKLSIRFDELICIQMKFSKSLSSLGCDCTIALAVVRLSAPLTTATHLRVIRLRRVLTNPSIGPTSVAV